MGTILGEKIKYIKDNYSYLLPYFKNARRYRSIPGQLYDILLHKILINTSPIDYYRFEFFNKEKKWNEKCRYIGKRGSRFYPYENNLIKFIPLLDDKYLFKTMIKGFGLPQPKLVGMIGKWYEVSTRGEFNFMLDNIDHDIVVKPIDGSCGRGVLVLTYKNGNFYYGDTLYSQEDIWNFVGKGIDGYYLIEEKVRQREDLDAIYPLSLNTFRIVTIRTDDSVWHVGSCSFRAGRGGSCIDNSSAGGIDIFVDKNGLTMDAYDWQMQRNITHHPDTGVPLVGVKMADFQSVIDLALKASKMFGFMGTIGWDIALSVAGPTIIEGNAYWDCWPDQIAKRGGIITYEMEKHLRKRNMLSRWDKTRIHPHFNRNRIIA